MFPGHEEVPDPFPDEGPFEIDATTAGAKPNGPPAAGVAER